MLVLLAAFGSGACARIEELPDRLFDRRTPRERYEARLEFAGLAGTALFEDWRAAAQRALQDAPRVASPHEEEGFLDVSAPSAVSFRLPVRRGQEVTFTMDLLTDSTAMVFLEVWELPPDSLSPPRRIAVADSGARTVTFEPRRDGELLLRAQPELLRGGRFRTDVRAAPTLAFPITPGRESDIGSGFGAPRDGGVRDHHGIDIFAPRGTAAVAARGGVVRRVETTPRGGNVVWLRDDRGYSLYYAHLDRQSVTEGMTVAVGDTVGFVGNTGNARTTPPHLHFGVYQRGPIDPRPFVQRARGSVPRLAVDTTLLGRWVRARVAGVALREAPGRRSSVRDTLDQYRVVRVLAATGDWFRTRTPDGVSGYLRADQVEGVGSTLANMILDHGQSLGRGPAPRPADLLVTLGSGDAVDVLGWSDDAALVRTPDGEVGWLRASRAPVGAERGVLGTH